MDRCKRRLLNIFAWACCTLIATSVSAYAQHKTNKLTKNNITYFIEEMSEITSGNSLYNSQDDIQEFLENHLHTHARVKSNIKFKIPGFPPQTNTIALNKEEFILSIEQGSKTIEKYDNSVNLQNVKISKDGRKATLKTITTEEGYMSLPGDDRGEQVPVDGNSTCTQILMLNSDNYIQLYNANCETTIQFQEF